MGQKVSSRPIFDPRLVHVRFVVDKEATEHVFLNELRFFLENINQPFLRIYLDLTYRVSIKSFLDYKYLLQENYV